MHRASQPALPNGSILTCRADAEGRTTGIRHLLQVAELFPAAILFGLCRRRVFVPVEPEVKPVDRASLGSEPLCRLDQRMGAAMFDIRDEKGFDRSVKIAQVAEELPHRQGPQVVR